MASKPSVKDALERARDHGPGPIHPDTKEILDNAMAEVKQKLERQPDSYVLTGDEFALFNYLRAEFKGPIWQKASFHDHDANCQEARKSRISSPGAYN
ncbi:hypothetical protein MW887_001716 [Aspergillus wentii]|nr:hypothetical protein MW887_001716 [Aspergillus wentii]